MLIKIGKHKAIGKWIAFDLSIGVEPIGLGRRLSKEVTGNTELMLPMRFDQSGTMIWAVEQIYARGDISGLVHIAGIEEQIHGMTVEQEWIAFRLFRHRPRRSSPHQY